MLQKLKDPKQKYYTSPQNTEWLSLNNICQLGFDKAFINMYIILIIIYTFINFIFTFKHWIVWDPKHKKRAVNLKTWGNIERKHEG